VGIDLLLFFFFTGHTYPEVLLDVYACTNQCSLQDKDSLTYYSLNLKKPSDLKLHHKHTTGKVSRMAASFLKHVGISILTRYSLTTAPCAAGGGILLLSWVHPSSNLDSLRVIQKEFCQIQFTCVFIHLCTSSDWSRPRPVSKGGGSTGARGALAPLKFAEGGLSPPYVMAL